MGREDDELSKRRMHRKSSGQQMLVIWQMITLDLTLIN